MMKKTIGEKIIVNASAFLGTLAAAATIVEVTDFGYVVHIDSDEPEWEGPIAEDGTVLIERPDGSMIRAG